MLGRNQDQPESVLSASATVATLVLALTVILGLSSVGQAPFLC